jgi:hypothetical protein
VLTLAIASACGTATPAVPPPAVTARLRVLLGLHAVGDRILDASYGHGAIWRGVPYRPTRLDACAEFDIDVAGSWTWTERRRRADLVVIDGGVGRGTTQRFLSA